MPRTFTAATSDKIVLALGAGGSITGAVTLAGIIKRADNTGRVLLAIGSVDATARRLSFVNTTGIVQLRSNNTLVSASTATVLAADGWVFVAITKAAGTATPRFHTYKYATNTWLHENGAASVGDSTPSGASQISAIPAGGAGVFAGDCGIVGAYAAALADAQVEPLAFSLQGWWQINPNGLWLLDQAAITMSVNDLTGNGANQTSITATTVGTSPVPVFSYGHD